MACSIVCKLAYTPPDAWSLMVALKHWQWLGSFINNYSQLFTITTYLSSKCVHFCAAFKIIHVCVFMVQLMCFRCRKYATRIISYPMNNPSVLAFATLCSSSSCTSY